MLSPLSSRWAFGVERPGVGPDANRLDFKFWHRVGGKGKAPQPWAYTFGTMISLAALLLVLAVPQTGAPSPAGNPQSLPADRPAQPAESDVNQELLNAAMLGDVAGVQKALAAGASVKTGTGTTALSLAALHGHAAVVNALLAAGADPKITDQTGMTPLAVAAAQGHNGVIDALASHGADLNATDKDGITVLMAAASANRVATVKLLLTRGADVNATSSDGASALMAASFGGYRQTADLLLAGGANVNSEDSAGRTPIMAAALSGNPDIGQALIAKKANIQAEDKGGSTALTYAAANGHLAFVQLMLKAGLKKNPDVSMAYAARGCNTGIVRALLDNGAKVTATVEGSPALSLASAGNCLETAEFLITKGADVNAADDKGMTAMMEAAAWGFDGVVKLLLAKGGDMEVRNKDGQSAWTLAAVGQHLEVVELFKQAREARDKK